MPEAQPEQAIVVRLKAVTAWNDLVAGRIYANVVPQNVVYPAMTYDQISGPRIYAMGGQIVVVMARYQLDIWAETKSELEDVANQTRLALSGYSGTVAVTGGNVTIDHIELENELGSFEEADEVRVYRKIQDYMVAYRESVPA